MVDGISKSFHLGSRKEKGGSNKTFDLGSSLVVLIAPK